MKNKIIKALIKKGVHIPNPESVYVSYDVNPDRISSDNVILYAGTKIMGKQSLIMKNVSIGYEAPVTLENTLVGENTCLNGGFFQETVFAGNNTFGSGAHVRKGTILEEEANAAHTVGLKQTILFPFVTLGSLINFCDCFMAGGTSRKNHSEVGSSFIHFNYTPNQDKATPSMFGDVHNGVMLRSSPIFLGGQGGIVGPVRIGYGCISAAGSIIRKNELKEDRLILGGAYKDMSMPRQFGIYNKVAQVYNNNIYYIAGLIALNAWYKNIRPLFVYDEFSKYLVQGLQENLSICIQERIDRLFHFGEKLEISKEKLIFQLKYKTSASIVTHEKVLQKIEILQKILNHALKDDSVNAAGVKFIKIVQEKINSSNKNYIEVIQHLNTIEQNIGSRWLLDIEQPILEKLLI
ncbi:MAG: protein GlmU [Pseudomonadota bacterium]